MEDKELESTLDAARGMAKRQGEKFTPQREKVLRQLLSATQPLKAYDLVDKNDGGLNSQPPTIYRALEFLCRIGVVHKIESDATYFACSHHNHCSHDFHLPLVMICGKCGKVEEKHIVQIEKMIANIAEQSGFITQKSVVELHGLCSDCYTI